MSKNSILATYRWTADVEFSFKSKAKLDIIQLRLNVATYSCISALKKMSRVKL